MHSLTAIDGRGPFAGGTALASAHLPEQNPMTFQATAVRTHGVSASSSQGPRYALEAPAQLNIVQNIPVFTYLDRDRTAKSSMGTLQPAFADLGGMSTSDPWAYLGVSRSAAIVNQLDRSPTITVSYPAGTALHNNGGKTIRAGQYIGYVPPKIGTDRVQGSKNAFVARPLMVPLSEFAYEWKNVVQAVDNAFQAAFAALGDDEDRVPGMIQDHVLDAFGIEAIVEADRASRARFTTKVTRDVEAMKRFLENGMFHMDPLVQGQQARQITHRAEAGYKALVFYFAQRHLNGGIVGWSSVLRRMWVESQKSNFQAWIMDSAEKERRNMCGGRALTSSTGMARAGRDGQYDKDIYIQGKTHY